MEPFGAWPGFWLPDRMPERSLLQRLEALRSRQRSAPAAFLMKYVAGGFLTTYARCAEPVRQDATSGACRRVSHKREAFVLVRSHQHRQGNIILTQHEAEARHCEH